LKINQKKKKTQKTQKVQDIQKEEIAPKEIAQMPIKLIITCSNTINNKLNLSKNYFYPETLTLKLVIS
jgi:hypothetical protein